MIQQRMELMCVTKNERPGKGDGPDQRFYYNGTFTGFGFTWEEKELTLEQYNKFQAGGMYLVDVTLIPSVAKFEGRFRAEAVYKIQLGAIREKAAPPGPDSRQERGNGAPEGRREPQPASAGSR